MSLIVHIRKIEGDEPGSLRFGQPQPVQGLLHALFVGNIAVVIVVIVRAHTLYIGLRSHKKETGGFQPSLRSPYPNRRAAVPGAVLHQFAAAHAVNRVFFSIKKAVVHHAMMIGVHAGGDGVVVGKSFARKAGNHRLRPDAFLHKAAEMRRLEAVEVIPAKAVHRNQDEVLRFGIRLGGGGKAALTGRSGQQYEKYKQEVAHEGMY